MTEPDFAMSPTTNITQYYKTKMSKTREFIGAAPRNHRLRALFT